VNLLQPSLSGDNEVHASEAHEHAQGPSSGVVGHSQPSEINGMSKRPLHGAPTVGVSNSQLVNFYCASGLGKTQGFILVWAECPYIQFDLLVFLHWFAVWVTNGRERE
jgi:hypothetical protein